MRMIVTVGWAIYPLGYVFGYLTGGVDAESLNVVYNLADFVNKIAFGLVTGIAFIHYMYMREVWVATGDSPTVYRYIDWLITVPLQMIEFYLILSAIGKANSGMFWRLLLGSLVMLIGGYLGEAGYINATLGFIIGMAGWIYILYLSLIHI